MSCLSAWGEGKNITLHLLHTMELENQWFDKTGVCLSDFIGQKFRILNL